MKNSPALLAVFLSCALPIFSTRAGDPAALPTAAKNVVEQKEQNALDLFSLEYDYVGRSKFRDHDLGSQDAAHFDFNYSHRFPVTGQWYLRTGISYERFDFDGGKFGMPSHLQSLYGVISYEYVQENFAGAAIELHPGFYFQNDIRGNAFDMPIDIYATFPLVKNKLYFMIGGAAAMYYDPTAFPIGGLIWVVNDTLRVQALFPKPAVIWEVTDDLEISALAEVLGGGYRMDRANPDPRLQNAVVEYSELRAGIETTYSKFKPFDVVLGAGYAWNRQFDFMRSVHDRNIEGAFYLRVGLEAKF